MALPPELTDLALDHLHDDKATLTRCSLVCRDWVNASRHHLWHTVRVDLSSGGIDSKLVQLLSVPHIAFHVRSVVVSSNSVNERVREETDIHLLHDVCSLLAAHPQIRAFTTENISFTGNACSDARCSATLCVPSIRRLALLDVAFESLNDMQRLWRIFPMADRFKLDRVWWQPWADGRADLEMVGAPTRPSYKELALGHCCSRDSVAKWLLGMSSSLDIETLRLPLVGIHDDFLVDLLRGIGVSLQHIEIGSLGHVKNSTQYSSYFDFSANTELKSISIGLPMYRDPGTVLDWITTILSQIVSTSVTRITFSVFPIHRSQNAHSLLSAFDWPTLVAVLERPQFGSLTHVVFRSGGQVEYVKYPHNFVPLGPVLSEVVIGRFNQLRLRGVKISIV